MTQADNPPPTNIVLTGFMGTGKTTVGRIVAEQLDYSFVDTDQVIEERHGPIADIFADRGEDAFRTIERKTATEVAGGQRLVIATGGRMLLDPANEASLGRTGIVLCLSAPVDAILDRVLADPSRIERPLLAVDDPRARIVELLGERAEGYGRFPQIDTDGRDPDEIAEEVIAMATNGTQGDEPSDGEEIDLTDAYAVSTPADNRRLYAAWADTYEEDIVGGHGYVYHDNVADVFVGELGSSPVGRVLDVGCGTGVVGAAVRARSATVIIDGIDISAAMLDKASTKLHDGEPVYSSLIEADLTAQIDLPTDRYGGIVSAGTFTHGHLGPTALDELIRVGAPGAVFAIGINAEHYEAHGFADHLDAATEADRITKPALVKIRMYSGADHEHADDLALVALFRKQTLRGTTQASM